MTILSGEQRYLTSQWTIRPSTPALSAPVVVLADGRSASAVETVLEIVRDNHLGIIVGERSGGTNGDVSYIQAPGGFEVRYTGVRVSAANGSIVQGRGIVPDVVMHPTVQGVRDGRDELMEAGIATATRLIAAPHP